MLIILFAVNIILIQIAGAYLRYLPFSQSLTSNEIFHLWKRLIIWSTISFFIIVITFYKFNINITLYKMVLYSGWIPYFLLSLTVIRNKIKHHIFVLGMQCIWSLMLHTLTGIMDNILYEQLSKYILIFHGVVYISFFILFFHWERYFFKNILSSRYIFDDRFSPYSWYSAILPLVVFIGISLPIADGIFLHTFKEQILRFFIPLFFFLMYRSMSISTRQIDEQRQNEYINAMLNQQLESLKRYNLLIQENQKQIAIFRHDLRHSYRLISAMLKEGNVEEALIHIKTQDKLVEQNIKKV